jgi:hypothetical protein
MVGAGAATGLLVPIAVQAAVRAVRTVEPVPLWIGAALALLLILAGQAAVARSRPSPFDSVRSLRAGVVHFGI